MQALQKEFSRPKRIFAAGIFACLQKKNSGGLGENYEDHYFAGEADGGVRRSV